MSASLSDILTTTKNIVTALNGEIVNSTYLAGSKNFTGVSAQTIISTSPGRVVTIIVCVAGTTTGSVWDASTLATAIAPRLLYTIPTALGFYTINLPINYGIVITPGTSMVVSGSYS